MTKNDNFEATNHTFKACNIFMPNPVRESTRNRIAKQLRESQAEDSENPRNNDEHPIRFETESNNNPS